LRIRCNNKIFNILEFWISGLIIVFPLILALGKAAGKGDLANKTIEDE